MRPARCSLTLALLLLGCGSDPVAMCAGSSECAAGEVCVDGACEPARRDAGGMDGGVPPDAGPPPGRDGGSDAGPTDPCPGRVACAGECCADGEACRADACFRRIECAGDDDCEDDSRCDPSDGLCTPWEDGGSSDTCTRPPERPDRFVATLQCRFTEAPASDLAPGFVEAHATPAVADFDFDDDPATRRPSIVWAADIPGGGACANGRAVLRVIDGETCVSQFAMTDDADRVGGGPPAVGDLDGDGRPEIVAVHRDGGLIAFRYDPGTRVLARLWRTAETIIPGTSCTGPSLADLDGDGRPEVLMGGIVYGPDGVLRTSALGLEPVYSFASAFGVTADVDLDGAPELVTYSGVYRFEPGAPDAWVREDYWVGPAGAQGWVAIADFGDFPAAAGDAPGRPEIVVSGGGQVRVLSVGGEVVAGPFTLRDPLSRGGPPTIADFDGDGEPEIGAADGVGYAVFELTGELWALASQDGSSGVTGSSVFDFEGDGRAEVIYADECYVRVYDGASGDVVFSVGRTSCTWVENPIVVDADGDAHSEIVIPLDSTCSISCPAVDPIFEGLRCGEDTHCPSGTCTGGRCACATDADCGGRHGCRDGVCKAISLPRAGGIEVLRDAADRWAGSRSTWNQHAYSVTNVDDDGAVPATSAARRNWEVPGLNNFRQNVQGTFDPLAVPDLTVGDATFARDCTVARPDLGLTARVCNRGTAPAPGGLSVAFASGGEVVCTALTAGVLAPGACERVGCIWSGVPTETDHTVLVSVDPDEDLIECLEGNDGARIDGVRCPTPLE